MQLAQDYSTLLCLSFQLIESQANKKLGSQDVWLSDAQDLAVKLFRHLASMQTLANVVTVETTHGAASSIDHSSVKVLCRAALETYLVFFYIYGTKNNSLSQFRHMTWKLGGLMDRQGFHAFSLESKQKLASESAAITKLQKEISASPWLQEYTEKQQPKLLAGDWRHAKSWHSIGVDAGFHKKYFGNIYSYLCGYSHASYLSALQVGQANSLGEQHQLAQAILNIGGVVMAYFAFTYSELFDAAKAVLRLDPASASVVEKWRLGHSEMAQAYGC